MQKIERIKNLIEILNAASKVYYQENMENMSNLEYDKLYDELVALEAETGIILSNSPTRNVGYELLSELPKEIHESRMLSLDKTKSVDDIVDWLGENKGVLSWKLDGLTIVLTYVEGKLLNAITRGNGEVGEVVTSNVSVFKNIPLNIAYKGNLVIRGEAVISYKEFEKINSCIDEAEVRYKNPRNLCSGSVRQLNNQVTAKRNVEFYAFSLVNAEDVDFNNSREKQIQWLETQGFGIVEYEVVTADNIRLEIEKFSKKVEDNLVPSDGLVLVYDDIEYGKSLGATSKFPHDAIAFKWEDETISTTLKYIEWSPSRTGLINPVAVFEPVELEGSTVARASVHNISIMEELELGEGDEITVYKANMIIPQISDNITRSGNIKIPDICPICKGQTEIKNLNAVKTLYCTNEYCEAKQIKRFALFVSRDALNVEGLSEATLEKLIAAGFIKNFVDLFSLDRYKEDIITMEGLGEKSYEKLIKSLEKSKHTTLFRVIYGLGIAGIGLSNAKLLCKYFAGDFERMCSADIEELAGIDRIGEVLAKAFNEYFKVEDNINNVRKLLDSLVIKNDTANDVEHEKVFADMTFVITGSVNHFSNRKEMQGFIEDRGGKVTGSVTGNTTYLVNNDILSSSSKNKKAKDLDVKIITEEQLLDISSQAREN
jgi:DNA ligase, NAD-dependent